MTNQHPITPPPELVAQWASESFVTQHLCTQIARWGADQELEACVSWLIENQNARWALALETARRPAPPTLKEQALGAMGRFTAIEHTSTDEMKRDFDLLRRAIEALPND